MSYYQMMCRAYKEEENDYETVGIPPLMSRKTLPVCFATSPNDE